VFARRDVGRHPHRQGMVGPDSCGRLNRSHHFVTRNWDRGKVHYGLVYTPGSAFSPSPASACLLPLQYELVRGLLDEHDFFTRLRYV
jgi:hypothetical protein